MKKIVIIIIASFLVGFGSSYVWYDRIHTKELLKKEQEVTSFYEKKIQERDTLISKLHKDYNEVYNENQALTNTNRELSLTADRLRNNLQNGRIRGNSKGESCVDGKRYNNCLDLLSEGTGLLQEGTELLRKITIEKDLLIKQTE